MEKENVVSSCVYEDQAHDLAITSTTANWPYLVPGPERNSGSEGHVEAEAQRKETGNFCPVEAHCSQRPGGQLAHSPPALFSLRDPTTLPFLSYFSSLCCI